MSDTALPISPLVQLALDAPAVDQIEYYVPGSSHGTTTDRTEAFVWGERLSRQRDGDFVTVLKRRVRKSSWTWATDEATDSSAQETS